jgi:hypothetical protein
LYDLGRIKNFRLLSSLIQVPPDTSSSRDGGGTPRRGGPDSGVGESVSLIRLRLLPLLGAAFNGRASLGIYALLTL